MLENDQGLLMHCMHMTSGTGVYSQQFLTIKIQKTWAPITLGPCS